MTQSRHTSHVHSQPAKTERLSGPSADVSANKETTIAEVRKKKPLERSISVNAESPALTIGQSAAKPLAQPVDLSTSAADHSSLVDDEPATEEERILRIRNRERQMFRVSAACAIQQGLDLEKLHEAHAGHWAAYCETDIGMSKRNADRYRAVARLARDCGTDMSHAARIAWSAWLELVKSATPTEAIHRAVEEAKPADALVTAERVRTLIHRYSEDSKRNAHSERIQITTKAGVKIVVNHAADTDSVVEALRDAIKQLRLKVSKPQKKIGES